MSPLVSILIPAYNAEPWIADALESVLGQTWPNREVIVVDDGSKDATLAVARRFAPRGVVVVSQRNQGASAARNHALTLAKGQYIQWLDADDLLASDKIEVQLKSLGASPDPRTLLSGAWGCFSYRLAKTKFLPTELWQDHLPTEWLRLKMEKNLTMAAHAWLISREVTEAAGPWNETLFCDNDGEYFARVVRASSQVRFVPAARSFYRAAGFGSISYVGRSKKKLESLFRSLELHIAYLRSMEDSERIRSACLRFLEVSLLDFYPYRMDLVKKLEALAEDLGGHLGPPRLSWKYNWIRATCGWRAARETQMLYNRVKINFLLGCDNLLARLERGTRRANLA